MSDDRSQPNYNLRRKRVSASSTDKHSEGFIRASELLRIHEDSAPQQEAASHEVVPDVPSSDNDEGGGAQEAERQPTTPEVGHQGDTDSSREAQGQQPPSPCGVVVEQEAKHKEPQLLRLRVRVSDPKTHKVEYIWIPINTLI